MSICECCIRSENKVYYKNDHDEIKSLFSKDWKNFLFNYIITLISILLIWLLNFNIIYAFKIENLVLFHKNLISIFLAFSEYYLFIFLFALY